MSDPRRVLAAWCVLLAWSCSAWAQEATPPTFRIGDAARPDRYEVQLAIDPAELDFTGRIRIDFTVNRETPVLWLNATGLTIESVEVEQLGERLNVKAIPGNADFIGLATSGRAFSAGPAIAILRYRGRLDTSGPRGLFRQQEGGEFYVLSQFEVFDARRAFPCFDEPGFKTPWRLTIDAPEGNVVVSNAPLESRTNMPGSTWRRHVFATTQPLPSYLVALAVGPFDVVDGGKVGANRTPLRYLTLKGRGAEARYAKEVTPRLFELLEEYFGMPYPFEKLDSVVIPQVVTFAAMENVGLITYGARVMQAKPHEESEGFKRRYVGNAAHEIAHMWFGNSVTLAWWDDLWLNEAFATWLGNKIRDRFQPEWDDGSARARNRAFAISTDRLETTRAIAKPVNSKAEAEASFDGITYQKGGEVLSMFEMAFTPEKFRDGVRAFVKRHAYGSASALDFYRALGEASGAGEGATRSLQAFINQPGTPMIEASLKCEGKTATLALGQSRLRAPSSKAPEMQWSTPVCVRYRARGKVAMQCEVVSAETTRMTLRDAAQCPDWVVGNADGIGQYVMQYDSALALRNATRMSELPRAEAGTLTSDSLLLWSTGLLPAADALRIVEAALKHPSPAVQQAGARGMATLVPVPLPTALARRRTDLMAKVVVPMATRLGWTERADEKAEVRNLRVALLPVAALQEGAGLRARAREDAGRWLEDRAAIGASVAPAVLVTAARFADEAMYAKLEAAALAANSDRERTTLVQALAAVRDTTLRERAQALAYERLRGADAFSFFDAALRDDFNRSATFESLRSRFDALAPKLPEHTLALLMTSMGDLCTPGERESYAAFFGERARHFVSGPLTYRQALETIDICIARQQKEAGS